MQMFTKFVSNGIPFLNSFFASLRLKKVQNKTIENFWTPKSFSSFATSKNEILAYCQVKKQFIFIQKLIKVDLFNPLTNTRLSLFQIPYLKIPYYKIFYARCIKGPNFAEFAPYLHYIFYLHLATCRKYLNLILFALERAAQCTHDAVIALNTQKKGIFLKRNTKFAIPKSPPPPPTKNF